MERRWEGEGVYKARGSKYRWREYGKERVYIRQEDASIDGEEKGRRGCI